MELLKVKHIPLSKGFLDLVKILINDLDKIDPERLNMKVFMDECGTCGCWLGWHCAFQPELRDKIMDEPKSVQYLRYFNEKLEEIAKCDGIDVNSIAFLELSRSLYQFLFDLNHDNNISECRERGKYLLEHKAVPAEMQYSVNRIIYT